MPASTAPAPVRVFLSTPSARRATRQTSMQSVSDAISIHALREEGDAPVWQDATTEVKFLSTPSARRATLRWMM